MALGSVFGFLFPGGVLLGAVAALVHLRMLDAWIPALLRVGPYGILGLGILLGWRFNRSRLLFAILALALADRGWLYAAALPDGSGPPPAVLRSIIGLLLPLNLACISLLQERGLLSVWGITRLALLLVQPAAIAAIWLIGRGDVYAWLSRPYAVLPAWAPPLPLPQLSVLAFLLGGAVILMSRLFRGGAIENGLFWALAGAFAALLHKAPGPVSSLYFWTAGLVLILCLFEASYGMAFRDDLTGLPGRRAMNEALMRLRGRYAVAMVDVDFFKRFNDRYGHDVGDQVLRMVAARLAGAGGGGKAYRYGGEEFGLIYPGRGLEETLPYLESLRRSVAGSRFVLRGRDRPRRRPENPKAFSGPRKKLGVTVSIGVAERNEQYNSPQRVLAAADKALYRAKRAGRNRVGV